MTPRVALPARVGGVARATLLLLAAATAGCGSDGEPRTISRDAFVETYVALRLAALEESGGSEVAPISPEARERVLDEQGVTSEELFHFVELRGGDVVFMQELWREVERRMEDARPPPNEPS